MAEQLIVASKNPVKVQAIASALALFMPERDFDVVGADADSGVPDQPMSDAETLRGAMNRLQAVCQAVPQAAGWAAIEGGVEESESGMVGLAWIVIRIGAAIGQARSATFPIPAELAQLVRAGIELGYACDQLFGQTNTKQRGGAIGLLTRGLVSRHALYEHAAIMAISATCSVPDYS